MSAEIIIALGSAALSSVIGPIAVNVFTKWQEKKLKKKDDPLKEAIGINALITSKLEEIRNAFGADRAFLFQFHNGGHFYPTGQSIQKFSMIYEVLNPGVSSQQQSFQNIPIGLFSKAINILAENKIIEIANFETDESYGLSSSSEISNTKSKYLFPVMTIDNRFVGIVGIDYTEVKKLSHDEIMTLDREITSIGGVLISEYFFKKKIK